VIQRVHRLQFIIFRRIGFLLLAGFLAMGCNGGQETAKPLEGPVKSGDIIFRDNFSQVPSGWGTWERDEAVVAYEQGGLRILVNQADFDFWSVAGRHIEDAVIEVDVQRLAGPEDNDFGVICRYQDAKNFYMFLVSSDGYYGIAKLKEDQHSLIGVDQLKYSDRIRPDQSSHRLRADCVGENLKLYVDGNLMLEAHDSDFSTGDVGVLAGAYSTPGVDVLFDNFEVRQP
jgi:hypothetical protein